MISTIRPPRNTAALRICVTTFLSAALFFTFSQPASAAGDKYLDAINAKLALAVPPVTTQTASLAQLETATRTCINVDLKNASSYVNSALINSPFLSSAPDFALAVANGLTAPTVATKTLVTQGAITAQPALSGSSAALMLTSTANGDTITDTVAYASSLVKTKSIAANSAAIQQIAKSIASTYPVIYPPTAFSSDLRIPLMVGLAKASSKFVTAIATGIGQSMAIDYTPLGTIGVPPYDQRERLARFSLLLAQQLPESAAAIAQGLVLSNPEVAPRIANEMLNGNASIKADAFLQSVAHVVDSEEVMEITAAISFGTGVQSVAPVVSGSNPDPTLAPYLTAANSSKIAAKIATVLSKELVAKSGTTAGVQLATDISGMSAILANKLSSFATPSTLASYQKLIVSVAVAASTAAKTQSALLQQQIADAVAKNVTEAVKTVFNTGLDLTNKNSIYAQIISGILKASKVDVTSVVTANYNSANIFAWGDLNPDETPNTNF